MAEKPIIFSGPMVRAILDGRKTQTRRVISPQPRVTSRGLFHWSNTENGVKFGLGHDIAPVAFPAWAPYMRGDRLWVRETWRLWHPSDARVLYRADKAASLGMDEYSDRHRWKPSIHMPKKYARIWLEVTGVRVERVQDISEDDAEAEGALLRGPNDQYGDERSYAEGFQELWGSINEKRGYGWDKNPWVWVYEFAPAFQHKENE